MIQLGIEKVGGVGFRAPVARVIAIGGAGSNIIDRGAVDGIEKEILYAVNTDIQSLSASVAGTKLQLGRTITRGLGTGGDPELGLSVAEESESDLRELMVGSNLVFLCAGLGGGTGSGAAPYCARLAKEAGAVVIAFVTMPFQFEGRRRNEQAAEALAAIEEEADAVMCFENDRMGELASGRGGIHEAFLRSDQIVSQSIRSILDFTSRPSLMRVGVDDLISVLRGREAHCLFGFGEGEGGSAIHDALSAALKSPLMDRGKMLAEAGSILVQVTGGPGLTYVEIQSLMGELSKHIHPQAIIFLGIAIDHACASRIRLTIISSFGGRNKHKLDNASLVHAEQSVEAEGSVDVDQLQGAANQHATASEATLPGIDSVASTPDATPVATLPDTEPDTSPPQKTQRSQEPQKTKAAAPQQEAFQFESISRGRFDKSEPTIIDGEDLDIPTFMRKGIRIK